MVVGPGENRDAGPGTKGCAAPRRWAINKGKMDANADNLPGGTMGTVIAVDLTRREFSRVPLPGPTAAAFFGGRGLGVALLFAHFQSLDLSGRYANAFAEVDPLAPENALVFATSPATGTRVPASGRLHVNFKSPLTGGLGGANSGGFFAVALKRTGCDALTVTGRAERPTWLRIDSESVAFSDAAALVGLNTEEITDRLLDQSPPGARCLAIGPAGCNLAKIAAIVNDRGRVLARGGGGAAMGAKNLLAVVVCPDKRRMIPVARPQELGTGSGPGGRARLKLQAGKLTRPEETFGVLPSLGTLGLLGMVHAFDELIRDNMRTTAHAAADIRAVSGEALRGSEAGAGAGRPFIRVRKAACHNCPIACTRATAIVDGSGRVIDQGKGPEFETVALLGANLSIYDLAVVTEANYWANRYGLDTISLGGTLAAFFELYETVAAKQANAQELTAAEAALHADAAGFVARHGTPGFGQPALLLPLVHAVGRNEGIGRRLAEGAFRLCCRYGHPEFAMTVKKLEIPAYDPRAAFLQGLAYEMCHRGACHLQNGYSAIRDYCAGYGEWPRDRIEGSAAIARNAALNNTALDAMGVCTFTAMALGLDELALLMNSVTGGELDSEALERIAWRILSLERVFNIRCGFTAADDWLPERFFTEAIEVEGERVRCDREAFGRMHREYYRAMGWDEEGNPTPETLRALGLEGWMAQAADGDRRGQG